MELRHALESRFGSWKHDLTPAWRTFFDGADVDPSAVPLGLALGADEAVHPGRKGTPPRGARPDSHVGRAFDNIAPPDVRAVVIGQDPYLHVEQATGRSFEQADLDATYANAKVSPSLRRILQAVALSQTGDRSYVTGPDAWKRVLADRAAGRLEIPGPRELWDRWQAQGVVFVNAAMTFNRYVKQYQDAHLGFWAPVTARLVRGFAEREGPGVALVAWGGFAQGVVARTGVTQSRRVAIVAGPHPNALGKGPPFLAGRDPLGEVNAALHRVGEPPVRW